jgi:hypothetical protein
MKFLDNRTDKWFLIQVLLCTLGLAGVLSLVQSQPVDLDEVEARLVSSELSEDSSSSFIYASSGKCLPDLHTPSFEFIVSIHHLQNNPLIASLSEITLMGRSLGGCGS